MNVKIIIEIDNSFMVEYQDKWKGIQINPLITPELFKKINKKLKEVNNLLISFHAGVKGSELLPNLSS
jgi:hypothetical protein